MKITKCEYNWDDGTVGYILFRWNKNFDTLQGGKNRTRMYAGNVRQLYDTAINEPLEYVQMVFDGTIKEYCDLLDRSRYSQDDILFHQYKKQYPDMNDEQIRSLIRKFNMYDS